MIDPYPSRVCSASHRARGGARNTVAFLHSKVSTLRLAGKGAVPDTKTIMLYAGEQTAESRTFKLLIVLARDREDEGSLLFK